MSLARAFTKRLHRSESTKRPIISGPVHLISTTNTQSYNAPNITNLQRKTSQVDTFSNPLAHSSPSSARDSTDRSRRSFDSSEASQSTEPTLTDASSVEPSPVPSPIFEKNHLSCYFPGPTKPKQTSHEAQIIAASDPEVNGAVGLTSDWAPTLPRRAPSHSKREHQRLARQRSFRNSDSAAQSRVNSRANSPSRQPDDVFGPPLAMPNQDTQSSPKQGNHSSPPGQPHPFGRELEQLNEVAEEFERDARNAEEDVDRCIMERLNLVKFGLHDYLAEIIDPLSPGGMFADDDYPREICWI